MGRYSTNENWSLLAWRDIGGQFVTEQNFIENENRYRYVKV
jgi:hypothetical protein